MSSKKSMPPPERIFARGLAVRKPKVDPYDPEPRLNEADNFKHLKRTHSADVSGTWATIDEETGSRQFDKRHKKELAEHEKARREGGSSTAGSKRRAPWMEWASESGVGDTSLSEPGGSSTSTADMRFENLGLDVDERVREQFLDARHIMGAETGPSSSFKRRNKSLLTSASSTVQTIIGGQVVSTVSQKHNLQTWEDRLNGRRGLLPKRYEEGWKKRMEERDEELMHATKMLREWEAATPEEKARRSRRTERVKNLDVDVSLGEQIPDIYLRKVTSSAISEWASSKVSRSATEDSFAQQDDEIRLGGTDEDFSGIDSFSEGQESEPVSHEPSGHSSKYSAGSGSIPSGPRIPSGNSSLLDRSGSTVIPRKARSGGIGQPVWSSKSSSASSVSGSVITTTNADLKLDLAPLQDLAVPWSYTNATEETISMFDTIKKLSSRRGRVVIVFLHEPVVYSTSAITDRLWSGLIQEIQFFPTERAAIVIFVHPPSAASLVRHALNARENDRHSHIRGQISVSWYGSSEQTAIYPAQSYILGVICAEDASRVLLVKGIPLEMKSQQLADEMKTRFYDKTIVKVRLVQPRKRYVQAKEGNMAVLEFSSIRDAVEVMTRFEKGVSGFEKCGVEFLKDGCDREPTREPWCDCMFCK